MDLLRHPPKANPTVATILEVERILRQESRGEALPLSISEIERRMAAKRTRRGTVKAAIQVLEHFGIAYHGSQGVVYTRVPAHVAARPTVALQ